MDFLGAIKNFFGAVSGVCSWALQAIGLKNSPEMQEREKAQKEVDSNNSDANAIKSKDTAAVRNSLSV